MFKTLSRLVKSFEDGCNQAESVERINKQTLMKGCEELQLYFERLESDPNVLLDLLNSLKFLVKNNGNCFLHLKEQGILQFMKEIFQQIISKIPGHENSETLLNIIELSTETTNALADVDASAKTCVAVEFCPLFVDILLLPIGFQTRLEVLKSNNLLLEECPTKVKEEILNDKQNTDRMFGLVKAVKDAGDYEFQVGVIECLMRLFPRKSRQQCAARFMQDKDMLEGFMSIKDKDFETDCRLFLNNLNAKSEDPTQGVFSLPCESASVGNKQLRKPSDPGYEQFWVDFNIGSHRITLFCEQSSLNSQYSEDGDGMWETVAIYKTDVQQYTLNAADDLIVITISLKRPICDLYPSQHETVTDNKIWLKFDPALKDHIQHAVGYTYNIVEKQHKASEVIQPLKISLKEVEQADSQQEFIRSSQQSSRSSKQNSKPSVPCSQESTKPRCRASVPTIPMTPDSLCSRSPQKDVKTRESKIKQQPPSKDKTSTKDRLAKVASAIASNVSVEKEQVVQKSKSESQAFTAPRTPQKKIRGRSKVKTPVVTVTPPAKKQNKSKQDSTAVIEETVLPEEDTAQKSFENEIDESFEVIPDSLPVENQLSDGTSKQMKASVPKQDDSGDQLDCSTSTSVNSTEPNQQQEEEKKEDSPNSKQPENEKTKSTHNKKISQSKTTSQNVGSDEVNNENNETEYNNAKEFDKTKSEEMKDKSEKKVENTHCNGANDKTDHKQVVNNYIQMTKKLKDQRKSQVADVLPQDGSGDVSQTAFGFDSLCVEDNVDCIPASSEAEEQTKAEDTAKIKSRKSKGKIINKKTIEDVFEFNDNTDKLDSKNGENKKGGKSKGKSFTDVDKSLKELADMDTNDETGDNKSKLSKADMKRKGKKEKQSKKKEKTKKDNKVVDEEVVDEEAQVKETEHDRSVKESSSMDKKKKSRSKSWEDNCNERTKIKEEITTNDIANIDDSSRTSSQRSRRGKVNYKDLDTSNDSFEAENVKEETMEPSLNEENESDEVTKTPNTTPEKTVINEKKVKSSLKKNKRNSEENCKDADRRKFRVSFDLSKSQSPANVVNPITTENEMVRNDSKEETCEDLDDSVQIVNETPSEGNSVSNDESDIDEKKQKSTSVSNNEPEITDIKNKNKKLSNASDAEKKINKKVKGMTEANKSVDNSNNLEQMSPLSNSSDSLYIESDDSYNARRYRMDVKDKQRKARSKRSSRSSLKKDTKKSATSGEGDNIDKTNELLKKVAESVIKYQHSNESSEDENEFEAEIKSNKRNDRTSNTSTSFSKKSRDKSRSKRNNKKNANESKPTETKAEEKSKRNSKVSSEEDNVDAAESSCMDLEVYSPKQNDDSRKEKRKRSRNNKKEMSYTFNETFEHVDGDTLSQQRVSGMVKKAGQQIVFERSYLKSKSKVKSNASFNKLQRFNEVNVKREKSYDPYDFSAQCDNSSMASERINRNEDIAKELKKKKATKKQKTEKRRSTKIQDQITTIDSSQEDSIDNDYVDNDLPRHEETSLVQDKKTKRWHRVPKNQREDVNEFIDQQKKDLQIEKKRLKEDKACIEKQLQDISDPSSSGECVINNNDVAECDLNNEEVDIPGIEMPDFQMILKEITRNRMNMKKALNDLSDNDDNINDSLPVVKTPCMINSISSTPKVGSAGRKHYYPLNISVIKTPQSCIRTVDSGSDSDVCERAPIKSKKKRRSNRSTSSGKRECLDSDTELVSNRSEHSGSSRRKSRTSTDSISFLEASHNSHSKSEKSWIQERKKSLKHKPKCKTYKYNPQKNNRSNNSQSEESQDEGDNNILSGNKYIQSPIATISSITGLGLTPAVTPSCKSVGSSFHTMDSNICSPFSPIKNTGKSTKSEDYDIEVEQTQENYSISLSMDKYDKEMMQDLGNLSFSVKTPKQDSEDEESDGEMSMLKMLQQNMAINGDSGFASGPSSEVRPSRSSLKRRFPNVEDNQMMSSSSSQADSIEERSTLIPKKLFKFDPQVPAVTPQALSVCSSWNDDPGLDVGFPTGLSTSITAFGADIQKQLQSKKQKIEHITRKSLKETQKYLTQTMVEQQQYQANLTDNLQAKMITELKAIEKDIQILCESEKKAEDFFKYQIRVLRNNQNSQKQRLVNMKEMQKTYVDKGRRVRKNNFSAYNAMKEHLRGEMNNLQKRLLSEVQKEEFMNIRKRLQSIF